MDSTVLGASVGGGVALGLVVAGELRRKKTGALAPRILDVLARRGPSTLAEIATELGMSSFLGRGNVVLALNEQVAAGNVVVIPAPEGTPQLQKVHVIRYARRP